MPCATSTTKRPAGRSAPLDRKPTPLHGRPFRLPLLYLNRFQIRREERALASVFGKDFAAYQSKVRRWL